MIAAMQTSLAIQMFWSAMKKLGRKLLEQIPEGIGAFCGAVGDAGMLSGSGESFERASTALPCDCS